MVEPHPALTPSQELHATLLLTHCLVGERIEGLKVRKLVARHKTSLRRKAEVTHSKLSPPPLPQALPPLLLWAPLSLFCLVPALTEDDSHPRGRKLLLCRTLAAITQLCLVVGLGFKYRLLAPEMIAWLPEQKGLVVGRSICGGKHQR